MDDTWSGSPESVLVTACIDFTPMSGSGSAVGVALVVTVDWNVTVEAGNVCCMEGEIGSRSSFTSFLAVAYLVAVGGR